MKKQKKIIINILLLCLILSISIIKYSTNIEKDTKVIKHMNESTQVNDLNKTIDALNNSHIEYANHIQACKSKIAKAITEMGVETANEADATTMANNIKRISQTTEITFSLPATNVCTINNYSSTTTTATYKWDFLFKENINVTKFKYETFMYSTEGATFAMVIQVRDANNNVLGELQGYTGGAKFGIYECTGKEDHIYVEVYPYHGERRYTSITIKEVTVNGVK